MLRERRYGTGLVLAAVSFPLVAASAWAQAETFADDSAKGGIGVYLAVAIPTGDLQQNLDTRFGLGGFLTLGMNDAATIGLRVDASVFYLGRSDRETSLRVPEAITDVGYDITTSARLLEFTIGPQLSKRFGRVVPYLMAGAGPARVWTEEAVKARGGLNSGETIAGSDLAGNWSSAWQVGGGLYVEVGGNTFLGLAVHYLDAGHFRYIPPGSVGPGPDGAATFSILETDMRYLVVQINLSGWHGI